MTNPAENSVDTAYARKRENPLPAAQDAEAPSARAEDAAENAPLAIDARGVRFTYDGDSFALDGLDVRIRPGEFTCILGGNGSGKSTFAKHINALLTPDEGSVFVNGMDTSDTALTYAVRQSAGMVFQNPDDQLVASLVEDDVAFGAENLGVPAPELRRRVTDRLSDVGLSGFEKHETYALSGGQKQRVAIAGALAMNPQILVLDEASAMLDPRGRRGLMRVVRKLAREGMTVVMITHFMEEAALADRVIVMEAGRIACEGAPDTVLADEALLSRLNLEVPFAAHVSHAIARTGVPIAPAVTERQLVEGICALVGGKAAVNGSATDKAPRAAAAPAAGATGEQQSATSGEAETDDREACRHSAPSQAKDAGTPLIELENVSYTYDASLAKQQKKRGAKKAPKQAKWGNSPDAAWALANVSLTVREGEFLGIAGHTGSGKSTLIQHLNGILHPTSGRVLICGRDVADKHAAQDARAIVGVVFQYPENQLFATTVAEDVAFGPRNLGLAEDEIDARVDESLRAVGLDPEAIKAKSPFELSGGQKRRVAFAGVLAMRPRVLVLDEPAAGLDPAARESFLSMVSRLHDEGLTVVMVSHNMDDLAKLASRVAIMNEGKLVVEGAPDEVFSRADELEAIGLSTTSAERVARLLRERGIPVDARGLATEGDIVRSVVAAAAARRALESAR